MSNLVLIIGQNYAQGSRWLRANYKSKNLDPQRCRIVENHTALKGLQDYDIIWLPGWALAKQAEQIRYEASVARSLGRIRREIAA